MKGLLDSFWFHVSFCFFINDLKHDNQSKFKTISYYYYMFFLFRNLLLNLPSIQISITSKLNDEYNMDIILNDLRGETVQQ